MGTKTAWTAAFILAAACAGEGWYIHLLREEGAPSLRDALAEMRAPPAGAFPAAPIPFERFDRLFDDSFFERNDEPFKEMDRFRDRMERLLAGAQRELFDRSWGEWSNERLGLAGLQEKVEESPTRVAVSFSLPDLKTGSLRVDVKRHHIRIDYEEERAASGTGTRGSYETRTVRRYEKIVPVPADADPSTSRVVRSGDSVRIVFDRRVPPPLLGPPT